MAATALAMSRTNASLVDTNKARVAKLTASAGWQARGRRLELIVSEYREVHPVEVPRARASALSLRQRIKTPLEVGGVTIQAESQVLEITGGSSGCDDVKVTFGIPSTMSQFLRRALCLHIRSRQQFVLTVTAAYCRHSGN